MPIHDLGYRPWNEPKTSAWSRWRVMAEVGIRQSWSILSVRRSVIVSLSPLLIGLLALFLIEQAMVEPELRLQLAGMLRNMPDAGQAIGELMKGEDGSRHAMWSYALLWLLRYPQGLATLILVSIIGPPLISRDIRSRAFLLYFSRPIGQLQYVFGKAAVLMAYLLLISVIPLWFVYGAGLLLSPSPAVTLDTWDLPIRVAIAGAVLILPACSLMLCLSSLTTESRNAGFAWYVIWVLGVIGYSSLSSVDAAAHAGGDFVNYHSNWTLLSLYHMIARVQAWILGTESWNGPQVMSSAGVLLAVTVGSLLILFRRVSAPMRV